MIHLGECSMERGNEEELLDNIFLWQSDTRHRTEDMYEVKASCKPKIMVFHSAFQSQSEQGGETGMQAAVKVLCLLTS